MRAAIFLCEAHTALSLAFGSQVSRIYCAATCGLAFIGIIKTDHARSALPTIFAFFSERHSPTRHYYLNACLLP